MARGYKELLYKINKVGKEREAVVDLGGMSGDYDQSTLPEILKELIKTHVLIFHS